MVNLFAKTSLETNALGADYRRLTDICNELGVLQQTHAMEFLMHSSLFGGPARQEAEDHRYEPVGRIDVRRYVFHSDQQDRKLESFDSNEGGSLPGHRIRSRTTIYDGIESASWIKISYVAGVAITVEGERIPDAVTRVIQELE